MNERTLTALRGSIAKWERLSRLEGRDCGHDDCPLCALFFFNASSVCDGCPVSQRTRRIVCAGTPYSDYVRVCRDDDTDREEKATAARAELDFLVSLLPPEGATP